MPFNLAHAQALEDLAIECQASAKHGIVDRDSGRKVRARSGLGPGLGPGCKQRQRKVSAVRSGVAHARARVRAHVRHTGVTPPRAYPLMCEAKKPGPPGPRASKPHGIRVIWVRATPDLARTYPDLTLDTRLQVACTRPAVAAPPEPADNPNCKVLPAMWGDAGAKRRVFFVHTPAGVRFGSLSWPGTGACRVVSVFACWAGRLLAGGVRVSVWLGAGWRLAPGSLGRSGLAHAQGFGLRRGCAAGGW